MVNKEPKIDTVVMLSAVNWQHVQQASHFFAEGFLERNIRVIWVEPLPHRLPRFHLSDWVAIWKRLRNIFFGSRGVSTGLRKVPPGLVIVPPFTLPEIGFLRAINKSIFLPRLLRKINNESHGNVILHTWKPLDGYYYLITHINSVLRVYCCIDNYVAQYRAPRHLGVVEEKIAKSSDLVYARTDLTLKKMKRHNDSVHFRDTAVDYALFGSVKEPRDKEIRVLGFYGVISDRLDFHLMEELAKFGFKIRLLGPHKRIPWNISSLPKNISIHAPVPYREVPSFLDEVDGIILPYALNELNAGSRFMKIYECLASGKPIFATGVPFLQKFRDMVYLGENACDMCRLIIKSKDLETAEFRNRRKSLARSHDWDSLIAMEWNDYELAASKLMEQ